MYKEHGINHNDDHGSYENLQQSLEDSICNATKAQETTNILCI